MADEQTFTTGQVAILCGNVATFTVTRWVDKFYRHLSKAAYPGKGQTKIFTYDDVRKLELVHQMQSLHKPFEEIDAALANGDMAELVDDVTALGLIGQDHPRYLRKRVAVLERELLLLKDENDKLLKANSELKDDKIKSDAKAEELRTLLKEKDEELQKARKIIWRLEGE